MESNYIFSHIFYYSKNEISIVSKLTKIDALEQKIYIGIYMSQLSS